MGVNTLLWTWLVLIALATMARLRDLATGEFNAPTPGVVATALGINLLFAAWVIALLTKGVCQ